MRPIIFFDGVCSLCNGVVNRLIKWDKKERFLFAPLQGEEAQKRALAPSNGGPSSLVYLNPTGKIFKESDAVIEIMVDLWNCSALRVLSFIPRPLRHGLYRWIARHRYRWFGRENQCRRPTDRERSRFLT